METPRGPHPSDWSFPCAFSCTCELFPFLSALEHFFQQKCYKGILEQYTARFMTKKYAKSCEISLCRNRKWWPISRKFARLSHDLNDKFTFVNTGTWHWSVCKQTNITKEQSTVKCHEIILKPYILDKYMANKDTK